MSIWTGTERFKKKKKKKKKGIIYENTGTEWGDIVICGGSWEKAVLNWQTLINTLTKQTETV